VGVLLLKFRSVLEHHIVNYIFCHSNYDRPWIYAF